MSKDKSFYYDLALEGGLVNIYDRKMIKLEEKHITELADVEKYGLMCYFIEKGLTLKTIATTKSWALSQSQFLRLKQNDEKLKEMFSQAKNIRQELLHEEIIELKDNVEGKDKIDRLKSILSVTSSKTEVTPIFKLAAWVGDEEDFN